MANETCRLPLSVMPILRHHWSPDAHRRFRYDAEFTAGEKLFGPHSVCIRPGQSPSADTGYMSHEEAMALVNDGVFGAAATSQDGPVHINEHAVNAFHDFCCDVWEAWDKFQARVRQVERTRKPDVASDP